MGPNRECCNAEQGISYHLSENYSSASPRLVCFNPGIICHAIAAILAAFRPADDGLATESADRNPLRRGRGQQAVFMSAMMCNAAAAGSGACTIGRPTTR